MKRQLDSSRFKKLLFEIGCFMDLYNSIIEEKEDNGKILARFIGYFYFFDQNNNLLSMIHGINGDSLLDVTKGVNGDSVFYKALCKYVKSDESFNETFQEYGFYFTQRSDILRSKLGQVELFLLFSCLCSAKSNGCGCGCCLA